jgi:peptidoglycan/LPS O-acetylase OafA/YrhL
MGARMHKNADSLKLLGYVRFLLALSVAAFHLWTPVFPDAGRHSVVGFFCISGFLVTMIANQVYFDRPGAFLSNRILRLYPTYLACLAIAYGICIFYPETIQHPPVTIPMPSGVLGWLKQFSLVSNLNFAVGPVGGRILTQTWSLEVEIAFYAIIGLCTYRSVLLTAVGFVISLTVALLGLYQVLPVQFYWSAMGTGFMFFGGSLAYFAGQKLNLGRAAWPLVTISAIVFLTAVYGLPYTVTLADYATPRPHLYLLVSAASMSVLLAALSSIKETGFRMPGAVFLGRLAYPVFLLHKCVAVPFVAWLGDSERFAIFALSTPVTIALSLLVILAIETPIERARRWVRGSKAPNQDAEVSIATIQPALAKRAA